MKTTLGARGFSCAVSGVGHVSNVTRTGHNRDLRAVMSLLCDRHRKPLKKNLWHPGQMKTGHRVKSWNVIEG